MIIKDINGNSRQVKKIKKVFYDRNDVCVEFKNENIDGELVKVGKQALTETTETYVEVIIVGKTGREWKEWYPLEEFEKLNPGILV